VAASGLIMPMFFHVLASSTFFFILFHRASGRGGREREVDPAVLDRKDRKVVHLETFI
jgi:hypothetical protein